MSNQAQKTQKYQLALVNLAPYLYDIVMLGPSYSLTYKIYGSPNFSKH